MTEKGRGDCMRAAIASMFELEIEQVPHFLLFDKPHKNRYEVSSFFVLHYFLYAMGYEYMGYKHMKGGKIEKKDLPTKKDLINGSIFALVKSRTYDDILHAVLINSKGKVIHDPNPNKRWLGENVIENNNLIGWYMIEKRSKL